MSNAHCALPSGQQNHEPTLVTWNKCFVCCPRADGGGRYQMHTGVRSNVRASSSADSAVGHFWSSVVDQGYCHSPSMWCAGVLLTLNAYSGQHQLCPVNTCLGSCLCNQTHRFLTTWCVGCIVGHSWRSLVRPGHQPLCWCASVQKVKAEQQMSTCDCTVSLSLESYDSLYVNRIVLPAWMDDHTVGKV